ncbi:hypothetical protein CCB80_12075 [Armatimonadetes bacterium Uphvl-Ar1]|nr:hypothetical protein CCB80_12075 [Armatimonadetes bacterium Uphvl-Ar1]
MPESDSDQMKRLILLTTSLAIVLTLIGCANEGNAADGRAVKEGDYQGAPGGATSSKTEGE